MSNISSLAFIHPEAKLGKDVVIDAFAYVDRNVEIGDRCVIRAHASILSGTRMGADNKVYEGAIIGAEPQDFRWEGEDTFVVIGNNNTIREHVIINRGINPEKGTRIGNNSFIMAQTHIGHDSQVGNWCVLGNSCKIAGDVFIDDFTILSSNALAHEGCQVGKYVLVKGGCRVNGNVPPYTIMAHNPTEYVGINTFVLHKASKSESVIDDIATCYRYIYKSKTSIPNAIRHIKMDIEPHPERDEIVRFVESHNYRLCALPKDLSI